MTGFTLSMGGWYFGLLKGRKRSKHRAWAQQTGYTMHSRTCQQQPVAAAAALAAVAALFVCIVCFKSKTDI